MVGSSSGSNCENSQCSTKITKNVSINNSIKLLTIKNNFFQNSGLSINTSDLSTLISNERGISTIGEFVDNVLRYLDNCINADTSTQEISSPSSEEYSSETEKTSSDKSSNLSLELLKTKYWILQQTKDQILKAMECHEKQNRLTLSKGRLEAEKLLLIIGKSCAYVIGQFLHSLYRCKTRIALLRT